MENLIIAAIILLKYLSVFLIVLGLEFIFSKLRKDNVSWTHVWAAAFTSCAFGEIFSELF